MKKENGLGVFSCVTMIVGAMIGSAIFSLSGVTMVQSGPASIVSWLIAAVIMLFYGLFCCELAVRYPRTGGVYVFPRMAFDSRPVGWMSNWGYIVANVIANAFSAICVGTYLSGGFGISSNYQVPIALLSVLICTLLNLIGMSNLGKFNSILVIGLLLCIGIYITFSVSDADFNPKLLAPFLTQGIAGKFGFLSSIPVAMVGYGSVVLMSFMTSEVRNPSRTIPRSAVISMIIVAFIYISTVSVTLCLISTDFLISNPDMTYIPLFAACFTKLTEIPWMSKVISVAAVLALFTTIIALIACTSKSLAVCAEEKIVFSCFAKKNKHNIPVVSVLTISLSSAVIACFPAFANVIVNYGALFSVVIIISNILALYKSRKISESLSFKAPGGRIAPALVLIVLIICYFPDLTSGWRMWIVSLLIYIVGFFIYLCSFIGRSRVNSLQNGSNL